MDNLHDLLKRIAALKRAPRTSRGDYPAQSSPYKPILLLTVLWRLQQSKEPFSRNRIEFLRCQEDFSLLYGGLFGDRSDVPTKVTQAFWYLGAGKPKMWQFVPQTTKEEELHSSIQKKIQIKTPAKLQRIIAHAQFCEQDWSLLSDRDVNKALISFLIAEHFTDVREQLSLLT